MPFFSSRKFPKHVGIFDQLMGYSTGRSTSFARKQNHQITNLCRNLYYNNLVEETSNKEPIIPKIVHLIWVGPKTPPPIFHECLESIRKHLSEWECKIWTDKDVATLDLANQKFYDEETNYGAKSDILRYELLYKFGGVYLDIDMVVQKPLDELNNSYEFYTGLEPCNMSSIIGNAIIASVVGHPILQNCIETLKDHRHYKSILERTGPIHFQKSFYHVLKQSYFDKAIALPAIFFYPNLKKIGRETFTSHHWANSWVVSKGKF